MRFRNLESVKLFVKISLAVLGFMVIVTFAHESDLINVQIEKDGVMKPLFFDRYRCTKISPKVLR